MKYEDDWYIIETTTWHTKGHRYQDTVCTHSEFSTFFSKYRLMGTCMEFVSNLQSRTNHIHPRTCSQCSLGEAKTLALEFCWLFAPDSHRQNSAPVVQSTSIVSATNTSSHCQSNCHSRVVLRWLSSTTPGRLVWREVYQHKERTEAKGPLCMLEENVIFVSLV